MFVHRPCDRDKADLFYLPVLTLYHRTYGAPEGCVLGCITEGYVQDKLRVDTAQCLQVQEHDREPVREIPSGRIRQKLCFTTVSFGIPSLILLSSPDVRGRAISRDRAAFHIVSCVRFRYFISLNSDVISSHIVWRHFSPERHKNFHSGASNRDNSPWISRQHW